jgi:tetratricopeptide (TPR) repeat protein/tRNA A-37 threonylcarbamoyl transferase component Bud32
VTPERWHRVSELYAAALERQGEERLRFVAESCGEDAALRSEVEALLEAERSAGSFLEKPFFATRDRIGSYELLEEIGRGGMGVLYRAARVDQAYRKEVAIKVLPKGMDTDLLIDRFRQERQILAALVHPHIAPLLDGGTTDDGLPFFVMELVSGVPIDRFCDERRLSTAQRLELFLDVCGAVSYAHRNLVVHRDLKPANVLVDSSGQAKLLDFGIAKLLDPARSADSTHTQLRAFTPSFASPEQIRGQPVATTTDVYSLGALLYFLLTGQRPYGRAGASAEEQSRAACDDEPKRLSAVALRPNGSVEATVEALAAAREGTPGRLRGRLEGDLDAIVLKALRKEPDARYASVEQLTEDIRRHLAGLPVLARRGGASYRAAKFVSRNKRALAVVVVAGLAVAAAFVQTVRERARAERERALAQQRFEDVRRLATSFLFDFRAAIRNLPGSTQANQVVVEHAQQYLQSLARDAEGDPAVNADLARAYETLAEMQKGQNLGVGDIQASVANYDRAVRIREQLLAQTGGGLEAATALAAALSKRASARLAVADMSGALADSARAGRLLEKWGPGLSGLAAWKTLALTHDSLSIAFSDQGDYETALKEREQELAYYERVLAAEPGAMAQRNVALALKYVGGLYTAMHRPAPAVAPLQRAVALDAERAKAAPNDAMAQIDLAFSIDGLADNELEAGELDAAAAHYQEALTRSEAMRRADPADAMAARASAMIAKSLARTLAKAGRLGESIEYGRQAAELVEAAIRKEPNSVSGPAGLAQLYFEMAGTEMARARSAAPPASDLWRTACGWVRAAQDLEKELAARGKEPPAHLRLDPAALAGQAALCSEHRSDKRDNLVR